MSTYKVKNIPGFEHLLVVGTPRQIGAAGEAFRFVEVEQFINTGVVVGDRELKLTIPEQSMWISPTFLEVVADADAQHEFAADNPFGKHLYQGRYLKDELEVVHAAYEKAVTVSIIEHDPSDLRLPSKTIYSESFFAMRERALGMIETMLHGELDTEDLIFDLKELKEIDYNG